MDETIKLLISTVVIMCILEDRYTHALCQPDTNGLLRFGSTCKYMCHCRNVMEQCDNKDGTCTTSGCANAWMGPGCQYRDIASFERSQHSSNIIPQEYSERARDGNITTCSRTSTTGNNPWYRLWLPRKELITGLVLVTEEDKLVYFQTFKITVENDNIRPPNSSSVTSQHTCYSYSGMIPASKTIEVTCDQPLMKNQVRVSLEGNTKQLVICDIRVYGGKNLAFGKQTSQSTYGGSDSVSALTVDGVIGHSPNECSATEQQNQPWWSIDLGHILSIQAIHITTYTDAGLLNFQMQARNDSSDTWITVHDDTGKTSPTRNITLFIQARYLRLYSSEQFVKLILCEVEIFGECTSGKWGPGCEFLCGSCINSEACSGQTGHCPHGCQDGYEDTITCKTACGDGKYGQNCKKACGSCKDHVPCQKNNGSCSRGCALGWRGGTCNENCMPGTFGDNCSQNCSDHCYGGYDNCNNVNGTCKHLCEKGWKGVRCDQECAMGSFGENCLQRCGHCLHDLCDRVSGNCIDGCMAGYKHTARCLDECLSGTFGDNCRQKCSDHCKGGYDYCSNDNGTCKQLCEAGWKGVRCDQDCSDGTYGISCLGTCGNCNGGNANCEKVTGVCGLGCAEGFVGYGCIKASSSPQEAIVGGVSAAAAIVVAVAVVVVVTVLILRRRYQKSSNTQQAFENQHDALPSVRYNADNPANKYDDLQETLGEVNPYAALDTTEGDTDAYGVMEP